MKRSWRIPLLGWAVFKHSRTPEDTDNTPNREDTGNTKKNQDNTNNTAQIPNTTI